MEAGILLIVYYFLFELYYGWVQEKFGLLCVTRYSFSDQVVLNEIFNIDRELEFIKARDTWLE